MADLNTIKGSGRWLDADALKSDTVNLLEVPRSLMIGVAGAVKMTDSVGNAVTMTLPAGIIQLQPTRIWSTGTTATGIFALY